MVGRFLAQILAVEGAFMVPAAVVSFVCGEVQAFQAFLWSLSIICLAVMGLYLFCRKTESRFYAKEGLVCAGISWIVMGLLGCLPFFLSGEIPSYLDALFEIVSGFTTTGASILPKVEGMSKGLLYWRSFSHWLGGMGVLVFLLAIIPAGGRGRGYTMHILRAESPGPNVGKLVPKMKDTAKILYLIYILLTVLNVVFLLIGKMPVFDAVCTAFGTAGTGGFGIRNDSIAGYSPYLQNVCTVFMLLFGVNFSCYYLLLMRKFKNVFRDEELRMYLGVVIGSIVLIVWNLKGFYGTLGETVRHAAFQVASIMTTTGFATTDFDLWPSFSKAVLLSLMVVGACAGSTGGGLKCGRALLLLKSLRRNIRKVLHPQKVQIVRNNGQMVDEKVLENTNAYLAAYVVIVLLSFIVISLDGFSITTNISAVLACFNNIGPGFDAVGPTCNFAAYSPLSKIVLIADMLAGRLEIFPILILFSRSTWSHS
jgi:trk system potassium uptake protein TrkH